MSLKQTATVLEDDKIIKDFKGRINALSDSHKGTDPGVLETVEKRSLDNVVYKCNYLAG
jgi:hypothetical protein